MNRTLWIAASGMEVQELRTNTIANNIANVSTTAYKRGVAEFQDMLYQRMAAPGSSTAAASDIPSGLQIGTGVATGSGTKYFGQGELQSSSSDLDVAIQGSGFFQVQMPDGQLTYTRAGSFFRNSSGMVVTAEGYEVVGFPTISTNASSITIASDGTVSETVNGQTSEKGRIQLARFANPEGLAFIGRNLYGESEASGAPQLGNPATSDFGTLQQHYLEGSNVEVVKEMVDLIAAQRAYELNSKCIKSASEMLQMVANMK
ncbi:MAG: flagellar basal-body rod protein FlgG [Victivallales bacterium]|nr:flagellar basal-body rod protein FlgG [Victivallales bacterium]